MVDEEEEAAVRVITAAFQKFKFKSQYDATGKPLPDGKKTKLLPSGQDGVALEVTIEDEGAETTRIQKDVHELRIASLDTSVLRDTVGATSEQLFGIIALLATFDIVILRNGPTNEGLEAASVFKNILSHHSGDCWEIVMQKTSSIFLRQPLSVLGSIETLIFHDPRFKRQPKVKSLRISKNFVHLTDEDADDIADIDEEMKVVDGWMKVMARRKIESQILKLDLQIVELGDAKTEEEEEEEEAAAAVFCIKIIDYKS